MNLKNILLLALLSPVAVWAQGTFPDEIRETPEKAGGVYYAYPVNESANTPAPKGYKPFYISHYGRHGSRYLISDRDYQVLRDRLHDADEHGALTARGRELMARVDTIWLEAQGRGGELSPLGNRQHRAIARRMYSAYPEVFADGADIYASSTQVMRCAHSMFAFIEGLKEMNPKLEIPRESGTRDLYFLNYHTPESMQLDSDNGPWYLPFRKFRTANTHSDRLIAEVFSDPSYVKMWVNPEEFMWQVYWVAVDLQNMETPVSLMDYLTPEELYDMWQVFNFNMFGKCSSYVPAGGAHAANACNLVRDIVKGADACVAAPGSHGAKLRFGHDGNILPLIALLRLPGGYAEVTEPEDLAASWSDYRICPMGANIQIVLFRNPAKPDAPVLAKIMLNERETTLPIAAAEGPFYRWDDMRAYLLSLCENR